MTPILVTGGAGFIGANFVLEWIAKSGTPVINVDKLTYAGDLGHLAALESDPRHIFVQADVCDAGVMRSLLAKHRPHAIVHLAAETHVDRSIGAPEGFIRTNVQGTFTLIDAAREYWASLAEPERSQFRFLYVSTDEVYGSLNTAAAPFREDSPYRPNNPYAASKAAADHLVRSYHRTYGLPTLITNGANTYGPRQFPEKLIPLLIENALVGKSIPVYGDGRHRRDWLYVSDHCQAICAVLERGRPGETYNVGAGNEWANLQVVKTICALLDDVFPRAAPHERLITFVADRLGHDFRYAMDTSKVRGELGWAPAQDFPGGLRRTIQWHLECRSGRERLPSRHDDKILSRHNADTGGAISRSR